MKRNKRTAKRNINQVIANAQDVVSARVFIHLLLLRALGKTTTAPEVRFNDRELQHDADWLVAELNEARK